MGKRTLVALFVASAARGIAGCGDDDVASPDPQQRCQDFVDAWCNKNTECALPTDRSRVAEDCHFVVGLDVDCKMITSVSNNYSACLDGIAAIKCTSSSIALPDNCRGVLLR